MNVKYKQSKDPFRNAFRTSANTNAKQWKIVITTKSKNKLTKKPLNTIQWFEVDFWSKQRSISVSHIQNNTGILEKLIMILPYF